VLLKKAAHDVTLDPDASAVDDSNFFHPSLTARLEIFLDDARDILWAKGVKIDAVFNR
jgi:hypothetical protein